MKKLLFTTMLAVIAMSPMAHASTKEKVEPPIESEITSFCEGKPKLPQRGIQWDGKLADSAVMLFRAGEYELDFRSGVWLWLYNDGSYYLHLSRRSSVSFGTDGDDVINGRRVGGCSREQLSEALKKNEVLDIAKEHVPEDALLRKEMEALDAEESGIELPPRDDAISDDMPTTLQIPDNEYRPRMRGNRIQ